MEQKSTNVSEESKTSAIKFLAIIGFITAIIFVVWASVQVIRFIPSAFSSLASMAEIVYNKKDAGLVISMDKNIVNSGEPFVVNWTKMRKDGTYTFLYSCTDGVAAEARNADGDITSVVCDEVLTLPFNTQSLDLMFTSEKKRFVDVPFTLRYTPDGATAPTVETHELVTVVNATIAQVENVDETPVLENPTKAETPTTPATPVVTKPKPPTPVAVTTYPVSNPNGYVDLAATYLGIGTFNEATKIFSPKSELDTSKRNAVKFEVKNIGTKTSETWTYSVTLPGKDGDTYTSPSQVALKPQERAVITLAFSDIVKDENTDTIKVEVKTKSDRNDKNNDFSKSIKVVE